MGLTFVPTPLGNLRDITLRALDVLRDCQLIVAEDTRTARRLLSALDLPVKPLLSYREQNAIAVTPTILAAAAGGLVVVVSDAGMPGISDPGRDLVVAARLAGVAVEVLPGPCAFVVAAVLSGFPLTNLTFAGFLPRHSSQRDETLANALRTTTTTVYYEAPSRIIATLGAINRIAPQASLFLAREITKKFEQQILGTASEIIAKVETPPRGEIALAIGPHLPRTESSGLTSETDIERAIDRELASGAGVAAAAKRLAKAHGIERNDIYRRIARRKGDFEPR